MTGRERLLLAALVFLRVTLLLLRAVSDPMRTWNLEESYNATEAWLLGHGVLWSELPTLQYRSFCGGCTVVSVVAAPVLAVADRLVAWKGVAVAWGAATHLVGFAASDRHFGRTGAWAWALLFALPPPGMADLSLMLWGNHVESGLFVVAALALLPPRADHRWLPALGFGLILGFSAWFARSALYAWALLPFAVWRWRGRVSLAIAVGLALGLSPFLIPSAAGDAGFYDLSASVGPSPEGMVERVATLLAPGPLADRLFHPLPHMGVLGALWIFAAGVGAVAVRGPTLAMATAWVAAYSVTTFPIFLVTPRVPVNNLRYHAPWALLLTLLAAAATAWLARGGAGRWRGRLALVPVGLLVLASAACWPATVRWSIDPGVLQVRASNPVELALMATGRFSDATLAEAAVGADGDVLALLAHMRGLRAGFEARSGPGAAATGAGSGDTPAVRFAAATTRLAALPEPTWLGFGEALVAPCDDAEALDAWLATLDPQVAVRVGRGAGLTLGLCSTGEGEGRRRHNRKAAPGLDVRALLSRPTHLASAAGGLFILACERETGGDASAVGACLAERAAGNPDILWGAGASYAHPLRTPAERTALAAAIGDGGDEFLAGTREVVAGVFAPYAGR